jgi:alpha-tubulin suppressor-like RCC1 family protein
VAFAAAGSKHTICIDVEGQIWFFGNKLSVGVKDKKQKL